MLLRLQNGVDAMTGMVREQERTAHNLANTGTVGFKRDRTFTEVLRQRIDEDGAVRSDRVSKQWIDLSQGALEKTGNPLDVAIKGEGFFAVTGQEGEELYTRSGRFEIDLDGNLSTTQGLLVEGDAGPITIPNEATVVEIAMDGTVRANDQVVGRLRVVHFEDPSVLQRVDGNTFDAGDQNPIDGKGQVHQGFLESSNVDALQEMTGMIENLRLFEMQQRLLKSTDENLSSSIRSLGRF